MNPDKLEEILSRLDSLENRITFLESNKVQHTQAKPISEQELKTIVAFPDANISESATFETNLGEYGLAWLGNVVLFFAIALLWKYFNDAGQPIASIVVGAVSVTGVFVLSQYFRKSYTYLSFMFNLFGFISLFYIILRLHFYNDHPFITNRIMAVFLLIIVIAIQLYFAFIKRSQVMAVLAFTLAMVTAFICNKTQTYFLISLATTCLVIYSFWKFDWWKSLIFILISGFFINLVWLLKNPISLLKTPEDLTYHFAFIYFSVTTALYSLVAFRKHNKAFPVDMILATILLAGFAYIILLLIWVFRYYPTDYVPYFAAISIYSIAFSIILKLYSPWKYAPALYALFGFVSISVTVFGIYHFPASFLLLTFQSLLVLALAIWYRSHFITLMNTFLVIGLAITYYKISGTLQAVNFSIPIVAFASARIIHWQKIRLNLKTEFIQNVYLFILFLSLLYATYKGIPGHYITESWLGITGVYFMLSILIKSIKYRWMAMANLLITAMYLFLVDLAKIDLIYRIIAFLIFAVITIVISTYYVKKLKVKSDDTSTQKIKDAF